MSERLRRSLVRFFKAILAAAAAAAITAAMDGLPLLGEAVPELEWAIPIFAAVLLALEKYVRFQP